ncbi:histone-lysine N-methyltransferase, H3 lysine-9 specific SUVH6-like [Glycine soja]|nr:histone-lysine N-methyltransferase, H3 lysine-9 specific SUVH6-like [Glycine soja]XP_028191208.1 histone-lysine N-methyltransferase, H3 lysine-9 specific SUVH6-like [Glycine soja]XP_028191210.1 histone-lysine N-methyltransferase, H3 lysine-9 specific SUVH6-like [Glycine soja]
MATPVSNSHFEEGRNKKSLMENEEYAFLARPMYKWRKVSAVRDFPEGCGPFASRIDPVLNVNIAGYGSANGTIIEDKNGEHLVGDTVKTSNCENDGQHSEVKDSLLTETLGQTTDSGLNKENPIVSSPQVNGSTAEHEPAKVTIGETIDSGLNKENPAVSCHKMDELTAEDEAAKVTIDQTTDCVFNKENPVVSSHKVDGPTAEDKPVKVPLADMEILNTEFARTANTVKCDSYMLKSSSQVGEVVMSGGSKPLLSNVNISAGSSACMVEPVTRRYLPRRKVSALRDFPTLCGRNALHLSKDKDVCLEGISSLNNKKLCLQNLAVDENNPLKEVRAMAVDDSPLKEVGTVAVDDSPLKEVGTVAVDDSPLKVGAADVKEIKSNIQDEYGCKRKLVDILKTDSESNAAKRVKKPLEIKRDKHVTLPEESNHRVKINSKAVVKEQNREETRPLVLSHSKHKLKGNFNGSRVSSDRKVVLGLMAESECPWRSGKGSSKFKFSDAKNEGKKKKVASALPDRSKTAIKSKGALSYSGQKPLKKKKGNAFSEGMSELVIWEKKDSLDPNENNEDLQIVLKSHEFNVNVTPSHSNFTGDEGDSNVTRKKVIKILRLFQVVFRKLLQEVESKLSERANGKRVDLIALKILKENGHYVNSGKQILGAVPGVEVGDEFQYRVELNIVGLHRQIQGGIDYVKHNGKILATSIVASGAYADDLDNPDVLIYTGQGGNVMNPDKEPEDQKLERGNLALKNSSEEKNSVRVIRGSESMDGKCRIYVYDGLYVVESYQPDVGPHGKLVFKFFLRRIPGQPELALREVKKSKKFKTREGVCVDDISYGKERIPICAVNTIDDEKPPPFNYITSIIYPNCHVLPAEGCDCTNGCSDLEKCSCVVKNGGEIPFNHNGAIVQAKPLVYECGPTCKCPSTCHNRVSQLGIKFQLEIFKTDTRGWGVRSLNSIPSGSFICEYIGELLEDKEAEQRTGNDEYLFDIGNNYSNSALWDDLSTLMPDVHTTSCEVVKDGGFTIDAAQFGNVGRFINHSCSPNLIAQNVLYDNHDTRMPHIMFFAADNIPPLQELTYDYNYEIDQIRDSGGNIKKKYCHCGSVECTGRMY